MSTEDDPTAWAIRCAKAGGLRDAAAIFDLFDSDHDNALVSTWMIERAEELEKR